MSILESFRIIAPEFSQMADEVVENYIAFYCFMLNEKQYGQQYSRIAAYYLAHWLTMNQLVAEDGSSSAFLISGSVISEKEGDLARSYGQNSQADNGLDKTIYGKEYQRLSKLFMVPVMTRMG